MDRRRHRRSIASRLVMAAAVAGARSETVGNCRAPYGRRVRSVESSRVWPPCMPQSPGRWPFLPVVDDEIVDI